MLIFYKLHIKEKIRVHMDLDISELTENIQTTNNPFPLLTNNVEVVEKFNMWDLPSDIFMTVPQLYAFCKEWYRLCNVNISEELFDFDEWFTLYLKSEIEALNSENYDLTYYDSIKLYHLKRYLLNLDDYKNDINPVELMQGNMLEPEFSWKLALCFSGVNSYENDLITHVQKTRIEVQNYIQKVNYLCKELIPNADNFLPPVTGTRYIDFRKPRAIMYFVNPFTLTDSTTNFLFIKKLLIKEGRKYESTYSLHNANVPL